jgi:tetratricopeptide (TPR) repeat protein
VLLADGQENTDQFFERSDFVRDLLDDAPQTPWFEWLSGEVELQRSLVWAKRGEYLRAGLAANAAYHRFNAAHSEGHSEGDGAHLEETYKGVGLMHLAIGTLPNRFRRLLRFFGYRGTLEEGLEELARAARRSTWNQEEALIVLATVDKYGFPSTLKAVSIYEDLWERHPGSPFIGSLFADALIRDRQLERALQITRESKENAESPRVTSVDYLDYYAGEALFRLNRCADAGESLKAYYEDHDGPSLKLAAALMLGQCREAAGDRIGAVAWYERITESRGFAEEGAALRQARHLVGHPMTDVEKDLLRATNFFNARLDEQALSLYSEVLKRENLNPTFYAYASYGMARIFHERKRGEEALSWYQKAIDARSDPLAKWRPFSMLHKAEIYSNMGEKVKALRMLKDLGRVEGAYDFRSSIENRSRLVRESLEED